MMVYVVMPDMSPPSLPVTTAAAVAVGHVGPEADGVPPVQSHGLAVHCDLRLPGEDRHILLRPLQVGLGLQMPAGMNLDPVRFKQCPLAEGEYRVVHIPAPVLLQGHGPHGGVK